MARAAIVGSLEALSSGAENGLCGRHAVVRDRQKQNCCLLRIASCSELRSA